MRQVKIGTFMAHFRFKCQLIGFLNVEQYAVESTAANENFGLTSWSRISYLQARKQNCDYQLKVEEAGVEMPYSQSGMSFVVSAYVRTCSFERRKSLLVVADRVCCHLRPTHQLSTDKRCLFRVLYVKTAMSMPRLLQRL